MWNYKHRRASFFLGIVLISSIAGCNEVSDELSVLAQSDRVRTDSHNDTIDTTQSAFAPTVEGERQGLWRGGPPPINKRQSGIDTYYQLTADDKPGHLTMKLRFEGVVADDAKIQLNGIDGARLEPSSQRTEWRLKPNTASEITLTLTIPTHVSYLNLLTFQNSRGSSRAFLLEIPPNE